MNKRHLLILIVLGAAVLPAHARASEKLTLRECIDTALKNQPAIWAAREEVNAARGKVTQAASSYFPQVSATTGYSESRQLGGALGDSVSKAYATSLSVSQVLYDFGKTGGSYDSARWGTVSYERDEERVKQETVLNVKQAYYALLAAEQLVAVARKTVEQTESHLRQAQAFFRAGSKPRFDVTRAEVDVNNARLGLINAKNNVRIGTISLNNAMGTDPGRQIEIEEELPPVPAMPALKQAQDDALRGRPELKKTNSDIEAAKAAVAMEESNYLPTLSASGAYTWSNGTASMGPYSGEINDSWTAGVTLTVPLFQGGLTRGRVSEARANLLVLEAGRETEKQAVLLEVNQAYADLESAKARVEVMESSVKKARESLELAQGRYEAGVGPYIEVTDAQLSAVNAETDHIQALYDYQVASARLLKAMGRIGQ
jgi:outer membrane protein